MSILTIKEQIFPVCDYSNVYGPHVNNLFDMSTRRTIWKDGKEYYTAAVKLGVNVHPLISVLTNSLNNPIEEYDLTVNKVIFDVEGVKQILRPTYLDLHKVRTIEGGAIKTTTTSLGCVMYQHLDELHPYPFTLIFHDGVIRIFQPRPPGDAHRFNVKPLAIDISFYKARV